ncbi:PadR family transcriptional regulator [Saccharopolyspora taberi]|uniref:PadR family transcriptional regulator n=1 Tax=Saccharopolyspora taberi TaxID=60895 RepID=A0ABN3VEW4_9PSEU
MALEHAILVSLLERSSTGYELARRFDRSIGFFWKASHQQIYRVLGRMTEAGWVTATTVPGDGKPDSKVYEPSERGRAELSRWLGEPSDPQVIRHDLAVKIRGAAFGDRDAVLADVTRHCERHAAQLELYRQIEARDFPEPDRLSGHDLAQYLVLRGGIIQEQGFLDWYREVLDALGPHSGS